MPLTNILKIGGENATEVMARIENVHFALSGGYEVTKSADADEVVCCWCVGEAVICEKSPSAAARPAKSTILYHSAVVRTRSRKRRAVI